MAAISSNGTGGGNWSSTGAWSGGSIPDSDDTVTIVNGDTITIDDSQTNVTVDSITINTGGKLQYLNTATVDQVLTVEAGNIDVSGTLDCQTGSGRKFTIVITCASDGEYGLIANTGSTVILTGTSRTYDRTWLAADEAANQTEITTTDSTGWLDNDEIAIASTTRTYSECEAGALNGNASGNTLTVDGFGGTAGGLAYAHDGGATSDIYDRAEIVLLNRSIVVKSSSSSNVTYFTCQTTATVDCDWVEFRYMAEAAGSKYGVHILTSTGSANFERCSFRDFEDGGFYVGASTNNFTLSNCILYNTCNATNNSAIYLTAALTGTSWTISGNIIMLIPGGTSCYGVRLADCGGTFTNNTIIGSRGDGWTPSEAAAATGGIQTVYSFSGMVIHSCGGAGMSCSYARHEHSEYKIWRNTSFGIYLTSASWGTIITDSIFTGNGTCNIGTGSTGQYFSTIFRDCVFDSDATYTTTNMMYASYRYIVDFIFENCTFGATTNHSYTFGGYDMGILQITCINCLFSDTNEISNQTFLYDYGNFESWIRAYRYNQTQNSNKVWMKYGTITDETGRGDSGYCVRLSSNSATAGQYLRWKYFVPVIASTEFDLHFWYKVANGEDPTLNVDIYDSDDDNTLLLDNSSVSLTCDSDWHEATLTSISAPTDTGFCRVVFKALGNHNIDIDDIHIV